MARLFNRRRIHEAFLDPDLWSGQSRVSEVVQRVYQEELDRAPTRAEFERAVWFGGGWKAVGLRVPPEGAIGTEEELRLRINPTPPPVRPPQNQKPSRIWLSHRCWRTDAGYQAELGASLFWLPRAMKHNETEVYDDLQFLSDHAFSSARIWHVKDYGKDFPGLRTHPDDPGHWDHIRKSYEALERYGLRAFSTLFAGGSQSMAKGYRERYVDEAVAVAEEYRDTVMMIEIANEYYTKGMGVSEVGALGKRAADQTDIPVALSAPDVPDDDESEASAIQELYRDSAASIATNHWDRDTDTEDGVWRPVRQPWHYRDTKGCPAARINSEPIGPRSSGTSETDPIVLGAAYANTFFCGSSAYVLHTRAGIIGDRRISDEDNMASTVQVLDRVREVLPGDIANRRASSHSKHFTDHPLKNIRDQRAHFVRAFARLSKDEDWVCLIGVSGRVSLEPRTRGQMAVWRIGDPVDAWDHSRGRSSVDGGGAYLVRLWD